MDKQLNEQLNRIKQMMTSIINEDFEISNQNNNTDRIVDCEVSTYDSDTMEIIVMYDDEDKYETYLISVDFEYEQGEPQTYDYPGSAGGAYGTVDGIKMTHPEERLLTTDEVKALLSNKDVERCVSNTIESMEESAYENRDSGGSDPDDYYDRMRDND